MPLLLTVCFNNHITPPPFAAATIRNLKLTPFMYSLVLPQPLFLQEIKFSLNSKIKSTPSFRTMTLPPFFSHSCHIILPQLFRNITILYMLCYILLPKGIYGMEFFPRIWVLQSSGWGTMATNVLLSLSPSYSHCTMNFGVFNANWYMLVSWAMSILNQLCSFVSKYSISYIPLQFKYRII